MSRYYAVGRHLSLTQVGEQLVVLDAFADRYAALSADRSRALLHALNKPSLPENAKEITERLGFDYVALVHHVDLTDRFGNSVVAISSYPDRWVNEYIERGLATHDPVHLASHRTNIGFSWDEVPSLIPITNAHRKVREDTVRAGIEAGFTIPANIPGETHGSCSFAVRVGRAFPEASRPAAQLVGAFAFSAARRLVTEPGLRDAPVSALTTRQIDCLILVGRGKTDGEIGTILGIAEDTATEHVDEARRRLDAPRRIQGVFRAVFQGQIALSDVVR